MSAPRRPALIGDWLGRRAALSPDAPAIIDRAIIDRTTVDRSTIDRSTIDRSTIDRSGGQVRVLDYATLERETNQVARWLVARGVRRGDRVAVLARNRLEYLQLWFACGKLGAILQALNWRLTAAELEPLIARAAPRIMCWEIEFADVVAAIKRQQTGPTYVRIVGLREEARALSTAPPRPVELRPADPWVLCYTGGTTGLPKAAILTHDTITWNAINTVSGWGLTASDVAVLNAPMFHTGGLNVFTAPLIHVGGCSILCRGFDVDELYDLIEHAGVTRLFGVPAMFQAMQAHPRWAGAPLERLTTIISGGAPCPSPVFERFWDRGIDFKTGYGLTEAGPNNFWLPAPRVRQKPGAVGWPLMHVDVRIVGDDGGDREPGEVGELWLRGPHVSPGYYGDPAATAASFHAGWLHTGDLASSDADGCVTIVGRIKDMYISGGENVYPAEIEGVIAAHPSVAEAAVVGVADERWGEVGKAFVAIREDTQLDEAGLLAFLRERLATYKLPKSVVFVDALPRTGAGKIDKRQLGQI